MVNKGSHKYNALDSDIALRCKPTAATYRRRSPTAASFRSSRRRGEMIAEDVLSADIDRRRNNRRQLDYPTSLLASGEDYSPRDITSAARSNTLVAVRICRHILSLAARRADADMNYAPAAADS